MQIGVYTASRMETRQQTHSYFLQAAHPFAQGQATLRQVAPRPAATRSAIARALLGSFIALVAGASLTACSRGHGAPSFRVLDARIEDTTTTDAAVLSQPGTAAASAQPASVVAFYIEGINESQDPLPLRDITFTAVVNGRTFEARRAGEATLARFTTRRLRIPAAYVGEPFPEGANYSISGDVRYEAQGPFARTLYDAGWVDHSVSFAGKGTLSAPGSPPMIEPTPDLAVSDRPTLRPRQPVGAPAEAKPEAKPAS